jgi:hypothetical protein
MPNEFSRNTQDASLTETATIPATAVDAFTADINLGTNSKAFLTEEHELEIAFPAFTVGQLANGATVTAVVLNGAAASPTGTALGITRVVTGAGGVGAAATSFRVRLPAATLQYLRVKFTPSTTSAGGTATVRVLT